MLVMKEDEKELGKLASATTQVMKEKPRRLKIYFTECCINIDVKALKALIWNGFSRNKCSNIPFRVQGSQGANIRYSITHCVVRIIVRWISIGSWAWAIIRHSHAR